MSVQQLLEFIPAYVLVFFRVAGMMAFVPLFGGSRIPRQVRVLLAIVLAVGLAPVVPPVELPTAAWQLAVGIGGELLFGIAMGMILALIFIAAQWAGEMIGQQMGLNLSEVFDPQFRQASSLIGEFYFMLTLVVFLAAGGHHAMLIGVKESLDVVPLLGAGLTQPLLDALVGLLQAATGLAMRLAGPMFITMIVVDVALGFVSRTMPQINIMSVGLSLRSVLGMGVLLVGLGITSDVLRQSVLDAMNDVSAGWIGLLGTVPAAAQ